LYFVGIDISWAGDWDLTRNYGLAIDNLLAADVVLAYGRLVTADERHNEDLFWVLRGGNFGIVTSFVFKDMPDRCCGEWNSHTRS
jgi:FAD/FMN-containing dehydrogenase